MIPVILSGGSGTRLWPLSRERYPKQFLNLTGDTSLLQQTVDRLSGVEDLQPPIVVCNAEHRFMVAEQLREAGVEAAPIVLEPQGRNTAPAVAAAALAALARDEAATLLVLPADHVIADRQRFAEAVAVGRRAAESGALVTFGCVPTAPETGYGYIRARREGEAWPVEEFVEKPDRARAEEYLASGDYLWNSGMFLFGARRYLEMLETFAPDILACCRQATEGAREDLDFLRLDEDAFGRCRSDSIDYAVMEKADNAVVVPLDAGWSDVGSWSSLIDVGTADESGNVVIGDVIAEASRNSYLRAEHRLVAALGMEDHVVVETADAVLVARRDRVQDVKQLVDRLKAAGRDESVIHRRVYRPWGSYEGLVEGDRFQVKHIVVNAGSSLSLQMHHHRAEHWIIVRGTARVTRGEEEFLLHEDQSTYIPIGTRHRLANEGRIPLEIIEVQTGSYLGEDDIVRFDDRYGRG